MDFSDGWTMREAPKVDADGTQISLAPRTIHPAGCAQPFPAPFSPPWSIDGVYPDPYYGLNNLDIPETLEQQDYWYLTEFS